MPTTVFSALQAMADHAAPLRIKSANIGSDGENVPFEQAFSNIAHTMLQDRAPKLLKYEVGFQMIDKDAAGQRAVGVFGFKVGKQWFYGPSFFLNGALKGYELLYVKNQDLFVPMKENWINHLLSKSKQDMGHPVERSLQRLGVMSPNLYQLSRSPYKYASSHVVDGFDWLADARREFAYLALNNPFRDAKYAGMRGLDQIIKEGGTNSLEAFLQICKQEPAMFSKFAEFYGENRLEELLAEVKCGSRRGLFKKVADDKSSFRKTDSPWQSLSHGFRKQAKSSRINPDSKVEYTTLDRMTDADGADIRNLSADEKDKLLKERVVVRDRRDREAGEVTLAYNVMHDLQLQNPEATGIYQVLVGPDKFSRCLVVCKPYARNGQQEICTVVDLESKHHTNVHPTRVWTNGMASHEDYLRWLDKLPEVHPSDDKWQIVLTQTGQGTVPVKFGRHAAPHNTEGVSSGYTNVQFCGSATEDSAYFFHDEDRWNFDKYPNRHQAGEDTIRLKAPLGSKMRLTATGLVIPGDAKSFVLTKDQPFEEKVLHLSDMADLQLMLSSVTHPLKMVVDGNDVRINNSQPFAKNAALLSLIGDFGLDEPTARQMLHDAAVNRTIERHLVMPEKYAAAANMIDSAPNAPALPEPYIGADPITGSNYPTMRQFDYAVQAPDLATRNTDRSIYAPNAAEPDYDTLRSMGEAAQSGTKEIFDTAALGPLIKATNEASFIDDNLPDILKGNDKLGRVLFSFYWHKEAFMDRYGKSDLPEIEDGLRNAFEANGDMYLKLVSKSPHSRFDEGVNVDLDSQINQ